MFSAGRAKPGALCAAPIAVLKMKFRGCRCKQARRTGRGIGDVPWRRRKALLLRRYACFQCQVGKKKKTQGDKDSFKRVRDKVYPDADLSNEG